MIRIYKRINDFAVAQRDRPPREEEPCEGHGRTLLLTLRTPPHSQVSIIN